MIQFTFHLGFFFYFSPCAIHVSVGITHTGGPSFITKGNESYKNCFQYLFNVNILAHAFLFANFFFTNASLQSLQKNNNSKQKYIKFPHKKKLVLYKPKQNHV